MKTALIWVDTSFLYAFFVESDRNHKDARERLQKCALEGNLLVISNLIAGELLTLIAAEFGHETAVETAELLRESDFIKMVYSDFEIEKKAVLWWKKYLYRNFTYTDCVSFEFINALGIQHILTYGKSYIEAGFN
ncbi:MAG: type II toxin-antitoxin system VapC family toxin [Fibrobacterota bacterium]